MPSLNGRGRASGPPRARKARTPEQKAARERYVERTYGVPVERQHQLQDYQGGRCWGCPRTGVARSLSVDHNHSTGEVRMYLCDTCNNVVGHFRDDPKRLIRLGLALINPPSRAAWMRAGAVPPGWESQDSELLDMLCEDG